MAIITHPSIVAHRSTILLVTPPPINEVHLKAEDLKKGHLSITRLQSNTARYADVVRNISAELTEQHVVLIDLWMALMKEAVRLTPDYVGDGSLLGSLENGDSKGLRHLLVDGLHLTGAGYRVFLDKVIPSVGKEWSQEPFDDPSWIFP